MRVMDAPTAAPLAYDFVVVGSGSAGTVLAARLAEDPGVSVCLIEAGGHASELQARMPVMAGHMQHTKRDWQYRTEPSSFAYQAFEGRRACLPRGKNLGGSSVTNYMAYVRGAREDFDTWSRDFGADGWSWDEVLPFFLKSEDLLSRDGAIVDSGMHGRNGPLAVTPLSPASLSSESFVRAAVENGFTRCDYNAGEMHMVTSLFQHTIRNGLRADVATAFLFGQKRKENLTVVTYGQATKLLYNEDKSQVVGVEAADIRSCSSPDDAAVRYSFAAKKEVFVSCGAIGSPHLLMLSGIGPADMIRRQGIEVVVDAPGVGQGLEDHVASLVQFTTKKDIGSLNKKRGQNFPYAIPNLVNWAVNGRGLHASSGYDATLFYKSDAFSASHPGYGPDVQIAAYCSTGDFRSLAQNIGLRKEYNFLEPQYEDDSEGFLMVPAALHPQATSSVELVSADPFVHPKLLSNALDNARDIKTHVEMLRKCFDLAKSPAMAHLEAEPIMPKDLLAAYNGDVYNEDLLETYTRRHASTLYHPTSTCKIGNVVDSQLRVKGIRGLRVVDASIMPTIISGNINAPVIMIAERAAFFIKEEYGLRDVNICVAPKAPLGLPKLVICSMIVVGLMLLITKLLSYKS